MRFVRKLLTKPLWWSETRRRYAVREVVFDLPPHPVNARPEVVLAVLTTPDAPSDAAWVARSLLARLPPEVGLTIVVDGDLAPAARERLQRLFPGLALRQTSEVMEEVRTLAPRVFELGEHHPMGRKLATVLLLQQEYGLVYADADVLCFGEMPEVCRAIASNGPPLYLQEDRVNVDPALLQRAHDMGLEAAETFNCGFFYLPKGSLQVSTAERLLEGQRYDQPIVWFIETTILAIQMREINARPLPRDRYVLTLQRQWYFDPDMDYGQIALRHFVTPVRHVMYMKGLPFLLRQFKAEGKL